jgi:hypothetical protein
MAAVSEVAENSLFAFADASDEAVFEMAATAQPEDGGSDWLSACVDFNGPITGRLELTMPDPLARHLCASFSGEDTPEGIGEADLVDFTGELANMMCGTWLTRARRHDAFSLASPRVRRGRPRAAAAGEAPSEPLFLSIDEAPIRLSVQWGAVSPPSEERADGR